jgi:hypothetical protein
MAELFELTNTERVLSEMGLEIAKAYKANLLTHEHIASNQLYQSIQHYVEVQGTTYLVYMSMADYWQYVEYDTKPHWPPHDVILKWIKVKKIVPRPDSRGRIPTPKQLAFLISRAMAGKSPNQANCKNPNGGTTGTHDLETARDSILDKWWDRLNEAIGEDATIYIGKLLKDVEVI